METVSWKFYGRFDFHVPCACDSSLHLLKSTRNCSQKRRKTFTVKAWEKKRDSEAKTSSLHQYCSDLCKTYGESHAEGAGKSNLSSKRFEIVSIELSCSFRGGTQVQAIPQWKWWIAGAINHRDQKINISHGPWWFPNSTLEFRDCPPAESQVGRRPQSISAGDPGASTRIILGTVGVPL